MSYVDTYIKAAKKRNQKNAKVALKLKYNELLAREKKAEAYLNNNEIPLEEREKWIPEYNKICLELGRLLNEIGDYSQEEEFNGFKVNSVN